MLDTHTLVWAVQNDPRLGKQARQLIQQEGQDNLIPAISLWEIAMLAERRRISLGCDTQGWIDDSLALSGIRLVPLEPEIAVDSNRLPDWSHKDPSDHLIVATARFWRAPLLTADRAILDYGATGHVAVIDASR